VAQRSIRFTDLEEQLLQAAAGRDDRDLSWLVRAAVRATYGGAVTGPAQTPAAVVRVSPRPPAKPRAARPTPRPAPQGSAPAAAEIAVEAPAELSSPGSPGAACRTCRIYGSPRSGQQPCPSCGYTGPKIPAR